MVGGNIHAFAVLACAVVAACAAIVIDRAGLRGRAGGAFAAAVVVLCAVLLAGSRGVVSTNDLSSYNLARAIAETRSVVIDQWVRPRSIDVSRYGNHYFSDRPPLTGWLAAVPYAAVYLGNRGPAFPPDLEGAVLLVPIVATLCSMAMLVRICLRLGTSEAAAVLCALMFGFASPAFVYGRVLFVHAVSAALVIAGCLWILRAASSKAAAATAGLMLGFSVVADYSNAALIPIAGVWLMLVKGAPLTRFARAVPFCAGLVLPAGLLMTYNYVCFGSPLTVSYAYCKFAWARSFSGTFSGPFLAGLFGLSLRPPTGVFVWSPAGIIGIAGLIAARREQRRDAVLLLALFGTMLLLLSKHRTWYGGATYDARYLSAVFPLLLPGVALVYDRVTARMTGAARPIVAVAATAFVVLRWIWATGFVGYVAYDPGVIVPATMIAAVAVWFLVASRPATVPPLPAAVAPQ